jgi:uncharacterized FAD-dependent dehydrogenase
VGHVRDEEGLAVERRFDVVIVGAGPAGVFAALELARDGRLSVLLVEKGAPLEDRRCPSRQEDCRSCRVCAITTGFGGAGAFSDGKLTLTPDVGGWLGEFVGRDALEDLVDYADRMWVSHGANPQVHEPEPEAVASIEADAAGVGMRLIPMRIRHIGTENAPQVLDSMRVHLAERGVEIMTRVTVERVIVEDDRVRGVVLGDGTRIGADAAVIAPGREGADWLADEAEALGIPLAHNAVDIGVRVEVPSSVTERLTDALYEAKLVYRSDTFGDEVRTFCMNPHGEVTTESYGDVITVNGHSYAERATEYTNFAVLVSQTFTHPFREPITYGHSISRLANLLGDSILVQRLGDLRRGRRSTEERIAECPTRPTLRAATAGDLSFVLPYRHLTDILEFLAALERVVPGVAADDTLLYGVEVKFYSSRLELDERLETPVRGLFAAGDGAGVTRGLIQSSASGVVAARAIMDDRA